MSTQEEQILIEAERKTAAAYQADPSVPNLRAWNAAKGSLEKFRRESAESTAGPRFRNLSEVHRWLIKEGYKVTERTVRNHRSSGLFPVHPGGEFRMQDIEAYAQTHLERPGYQDRDQQAPSAKDRFLEAQALERELKVKQLRGALIDAAEEEARDAQLWRAVRSDIEQQAPDVINRLVEKVLSFDVSDDLRHRLTASLPELREQYIDDIADIFDRHSREGGVYLED